MSKMLFCNICLTHTMDADELHEFSELTLAPPSDRALKRYEWHVCRQCLEAATRRLLETVIGSGAPKPAIIETAGDGAVRQEIVGFSCKRVIERLAERLNPAWNYDPESKYGIEVSGAICSMILSLQKYGVIARAEDERQHEIDVLEQARTRLRAHAQGEIERFAKAVRAQLLSETTSGKLLVSPVATLQFADTIEQRLTDFVTEVEKGLDA